MHLPIRRSNLVSLPPSSILSTGMPAPFEKQRVGNLFFRHDVFSVTAARILLSTWLALFEFQCSSHWNHNLLKLDIFSLNYHYGGLFPFLMTNRFLILPFSFCGPPEPRHLSVPDYSSKSQKTVSANPQFISQFCQSSLRSLSFFLYSASLSIFNWIEAARPNDPYPRA